MDEKGNNNDPSITIIDEKDGPFLLDKNEQVCC